MNCGHGCKSPRHEALRENQINIENCKPGRMVAACFAAARQEDRQSDAATERSLRRSSQNYNVAQAETAKERTCERETQGVVRKHSPKADERTSLRAIRSLEGV